MTGMASLTLQDLTEELAHAQAWSMALAKPLTAEQIAWRPDQNSSAIGWHLGHQGVVAHFMMRNLTAAEASFNPAFDALFDSATSEPARGDLPALDEIGEYRMQIAASITSVMERIATGAVGAPAQLAVIAAGLMYAVINHEYQHAKWVGEVRSSMIGQPLPKPESDRLSSVDGYWMLTRG